MAFLPQLTAKTGSKSSCASLFKQFLKIEENRMCTEDVRILFFLKVLLRKVMVLMGTHPTTHDHPLIYQHTRTINPFRC